MRVPLQQTGTVGRVEAAGLVCCIDELGATVRGQRQGLVAPPAIDRRMVAGKKHVGNGAGGPGKAFRPAVVRAIEQAGGKAVLLVRACVAEHARLQPRDRVEKSQRRDLAAGKNEIAETQLDIDVAVDETLVDEARLADWTIILILLDASSPHPI